MQNNIELYVAPRSKVLGRIHLQNCYIKKNLSSSPKKKKCSTALPQLGFTLILCLIFISFMNCTQRSPLAGQYGVHLDSTMMRN